MDMRADSSLAEQFAGALDWWHEAGVEHDFADSPHSWIAPEALEEPIEPSRPAAAMAPKPAPAPTPEVDRSSWPVDLATFATWWLSDPLLDGGQLTGRVAPRGVAGAELMVLVAEPERGDSTELLSGPQGRLLSSMLAAMGIAPKSCYFASLLPRHTPHADWAVAAERGQGELACHHVALASPKRLITFGSSILPLLGHDPANFPAGAGEFQHGDCKLPMLAARDLGLLLERPRWKAGFWQMWLDWTKNA